MTYKDPDKQREANRKAQAKFKAKGITDKVLPSGPHGATVLGIDSMETADSVLEKARQQGMTLGAKAHKLNRMANVINEQVLSKPKRGKDIKTFADLPPDVQQTIDSMSDTKEEKVKRTAAAIKYQHLFPDRFNSTGVAV